MSYHITIKQVTREQVENRVWKQVGTVKDDEGDDKPEYAYVTEETTADIERTVYTQRVDDLDLVEVIKAVNLPLESIPPVIKKGTSDGKVSISNQ